MAITYTELADETPASLNVGPIEKVCHCSVRMFMGWVTLNVGSHIYAKRRGDGSRSTGSLSNPIQSFKSGAARQLATLNKIR